jgi:hypothetical protein
VPSATFISNAKLPKHKIKFHKKSTDGSAKANAFETFNPNDFMLGVVFNINENEKSSLNDAEGLGHGYLEKNVTVVLSDGSEEIAQVYYADNVAIDESLIPYSWYMDFIVVGAEDYQFPENYITALKNIATKHDSNEVRRRKSEFVIARHKDKL